MLRCHLCKWHWVICTCDLSDLIGMAPHQVPLLLFYLHDLHSLWAHSTFRPGHLIKWAKNGFFGLGTSASVANNTQSSNHPDWNIMLSDWFLLLYLSCITNTLSCEFEGKVVTLEQIHLYRSPTQLSQQYKIIIEKIYLLVHGRQIHYFL